MRSLLRVLAGVALLCTGCGDSSDPDEDAGPSGMDAGPIIGTDAGPDAGPVAIDAGPLPGDAGVTGACIEYVDTILALRGPPPADGGVRNDAIASALSVCTRGDDCFDCTLAGGSGDECGPGGTLRSCVVDCISANDFGACTDGACDTGLTCDTDANVCRLAGASAINDAISAGELDLTCLSCFALIPQCISESNCTFNCAGNPSSCACELCQCDNGCYDAFQYCAGFPAQVDCAEREVECAM